jgi:hypothetical protein
MTGLGVLATITLLFSIGALCEKYKIKAPKPSFAAAYSAAHLNSKGK